MLYVDKYILVVYRSCFVLPKKQKIGGEMMKNNNVLNKVNHLLKMRLCFLHATKRNKSITTAECQKKNLKRPPVRLPFNPFPW